MTTILSEIASSSPTLSPCAIIASSFVGCEQQQQLPLDTILYEIFSLETVIDDIQNHHRQLVEKKHRMAHSMDLHTVLIS
ncbi:hypothetical protein BDR06DRAFT_1020965 [Suillus hirtellus]|nr:hypothetical protein BDR06DRAFT_1020965 [Suillus hirtellus]